MTQEKMIFPEAVKQSIVECLNKYGFSEDTEYDLDIMHLSVFPSKPSKKLIFLILMYKRECSVEILKKISDQPAGIVRSLREDGFIFRSHPKFQSKFQFQNENGIECREIISLQTEKGVVQGIVKELVDKSFSACLAAIEIYNKPVSLYREESFSILMINAWELLVKAKIVYDNGNKIESIIVYEDGKSKKSRSGNDLTIELKGALNRLISKNILDVRCRKNIDILTEIRDSAVHFINSHPLYKKKVFEIGTASLVNYMNCCQKWFKKDMSKYNLYLMPISFLQPKDVKTTITSSQNIIRLIEFIYETEKEHPSTPEDEYNVSLDVEFNVKKSSDPQKLTILVGPSSDRAVPMKVEEESLFQKNYPWDYKELIQTLKSRYSDFSLNIRFYVLKQKLEGEDELFSKIRYLHISKKEGTKRRFYSPNILQRLDLEYTRVKTSQASPNK